MKLNNFNFEMTDEELFSASWETEDARFSVWINTNGDLVNGTIYKSPLLHIPYGGEGWFEARQLDAGNKTNARIVAEIKRLIVERDLINVATFAKQAADYAQQRERAAREAASYRAAFVAGAIAMGKAGNPEEAHFSLHLAQRGNTLTNAAIQAFGSTFVSEVRRRSE